METDFDVEKIEQFVDMMIEQDRHRGQRMMIYPPNGMLYGFPKAFDPLSDDGLEAEGDISKWLLTNGYPEFIIKEMGERLQIRFWYESLDKKAN